MTHNTHGKMVMFTEKVAMKKMASSAQGRLYSFHKSGMGTVRDGNCPVGTVRDGNCPVGIVRDGDCPGWELSGYLIIFINSSYESVVNILLKFRKIVSRTIFSILSIYIYSIALTPATYILSLMIFQVRCHSFTIHVPPWLPTILILLSNDIHLNPGPHFHNSFLNFMLWNLNSLVKDNLQRIRLIDAHNSLFNYDLISNCETSLNDSVELPETLINDYTFVPANNPANVRHGGVGLFFKNSLPIIDRNDLSIDESIVIELKFGRKKVFCTVLYRSPAFSH